MKHEQYFGILFAIYIAPSLPRWTRDAAAAICFACGLYFALVRS